MGILSFGTELFLLKSLLLYVFEAQTLGLSQTSISVFPLNSEKIPLSHFMTGRVPQRRRLLSVTQLVPFQ